MHLIPGSWRCVLSSFYCTYEMRGVVAADGAATIKEIPIPIPGEGQVVIRVQCCAVNRLDLLQVSGAHPPPRGAGPVLGVEVAGTFVSAGEGCTGDWREGETVCALAMGGGYAEFCVASEKTTWPCARLVPTMSLAQLSAIPEAMMTAYQLLFFVAEAKRGETVLLHAAASSIGQALIQMCVRKGIRVLATTRSLDKRETCLQLGASECFVVSGSFSAEVLQAAKGGVDAVFCPVGYSYFTENVASLAIDGRYILYGTLSGAAEEPGPNVLGKLLAKRISLLPSTLRSRSDAYKAELGARLAADEECGISAIIPSKYQIHVDEVLPLERFADAHAKMSSNSNIGKIVLTVTANASAIEFFRAELDTVMKRGGVK